MTGISSMEQGVLDNLLLEAVDGYDVEHAKTYVRKGANVNVNISNVREVIAVNSSYHTTNGAAPLYHRMMAERWSDEMSDFLLSQGVSVDVKNFNGNTPLMLAVKNGDLRKVNYFLQRKADPLATNNAGEMVLQQAQLLNRSLDNRPAIIDALVARLEDAPAKEPAAHGAHAASDGAAEIATHQDIRPLHTVTFNAQAEAGEKPAPSNSPAAKPKAGFNL